MRRTLLDRSFMAMVAGGLIVVAGAIGQQPAQAQAPSGAVGIQNYMFIPGMMSVPVGTTVTWMNNDPVAHTSTSDTGTWDSGSINPGGSFSHTFMTAGTFYYHCHIHPYMHGVIMVGSSMPVSPPPMYGQGFGRLAASPNPTFNGGRTTIFGAGFTPGGPVFVQWRRPNGSMSALTVRAGFSGSFAFGFIVNPRFGCGPRLFFAFDIARRMWSGPFLLSVIC